MVYSRAALRVAPITSQLPTPYMSSTLLALLVGSTCSGGCAEDTDGLLTRRLESCSHLIDPLLVGRVKVFVPLVGFVYVEPGHISSVIAGV